MNVIKMFNQLEPSDAQARLTRCCGAERWVMRMVERRPFANMEQLRQAADEIWWALDPTDWREAFTHHPKIGDLAVYARSLPARQIGPLVNRPV